ncbi:hypothetical protein TWF281_011781 [Arthrobotrys megalospora]
MNSLLKTIVICVLAIGAVAQDTSSTECSPETLPAFCPTVYNSCCKYLCTKNGEGACWDRDITDTSASLAPEDRITCQLCPTGFGSIPSTLRSDPPAVSTEGSPAYTPAPAGNGTATTLYTPPPSVPTNNSTGNGTKTSSLPEPTYSSGASSVLAIGGTAIVGVFCFMLAL